MIVSDAWIENKKKEKGQAFCDIMLKDSYRHPRGNIFIQRENLLRAEQGVSGSEMIANFSKAAYSWAKSGFSLVDEKTYSDRLSVCNGCVNWDTEGMLPRCKICGCYVGKLRLATEKCPIGKW